MRWWNICRSQKTVPWTKLLFGSISLVRGTEHRGIVCSPISEGSAEIKFGYTFGHLFTSFSHDNSQLFYLKMTTSIHVCIYQLHT